MQTIQQNPVTYIETFDLPGSTIGTTLLTNGGSVTIETAGGGFSSLNEATDLYVKSGTTTNNTGSLGIRQYTDSYAAAPAGDSTNFAFAPAHSGSLPVSVRVEYATDLATYWLGQRISYLGLYYGSIDTYNEIRFYNDGVNGSNLLKVGTGTDLLADGVITGTEILALYDGSSGNQSSSF